MGVNAGSLKVIDIEVILENRPLVLLYGTVVVLVVFVVHTIQYFFFITFVTA